MAALPPFLRPWGPGPAVDQGQQEAVLPHGHPIGLVHALWWSSSNHTPSKVVIFIPGNPGILHFYVPFLSELHRKDPRCAILAHSHAGHTPGLHPPASHGLSIQVQGAIEAFDSLKSYAPNVPIIIIGHSIGSWITLQVLKARSAEVSGVFLLFPTISHIGSTPNGRRLSWAFPWAKTISRLAYGLRLCPLSSLLSWMFSAWPLSQQHVLERLLSSPTTIFAALSLADEEMKSVRDLEVQVLQQHTRKIWMYFAQVDDWVGAQREAIMHSLGHDAASIRVVHGHHGIPHAYCINHGKPLAEQCSLWLKDFDA